ncbi:MAG: response regulator transcription factor [Anaerolineae bacterium]|nr:response regulator transcription factor [Anaerolineae bacterium]
MDNNHHLLIVEDHYELAELVVAFFSDEGYTVHHAATGQEALDLSLTEPIELALLDIRLPDFDGYEVVNRLRQNPKTAQMPVILLTERRDRSYRLQGLEMGVLDYITKPFDLDELRLRVRNALARGQMRNTINPITELPQPVICERELQQAIVAEHPWTVVQVTLSGLEAYGFIAKNDVVRALSVMLRSSLRDLDLTDTFAGHLQDHELVIVTVPEKSQAIQARLSQRIRESIQQFLPARGSEAPKVVLMMGEIDHLNTAVTSVETLRDALSAALVPVALTTA